MKKPCTSLKKTAYLHPPSFDPVSNICYLQDHGQFYSCMHQDDKYRRLCPCRDYDLEQVALCKNCL